jgi:predicted phosphodiesterase
MANKTKGWQKFLACTCTHGSEADPRALDAILRLREAWKPDFVLHLGDAIDVRNMRAGARRDSTDPDYGASMTDDVLQGLAFVKELRPNIYLFGNHEARLAQMQHSASGVHRDAATGVLDRIQTAADKMKCRIIPYKGVHPDCAFLLGDTAFIHGALFGTSAVRDSCEYFGRSVVMGHTHRVAMESARIHAKATGYNIGCGVKLDIEYAATRRQTLGWRHAAAYGHFNGTHCIVNIAVFDPHYQLPM